MLSSNLLRKTAQGKAGDYDYSCLMICVPEETKEDILALNRALIQDEDLYEIPDDPTMGRTLEPHVTALYGIRESDCLDRVQTVVDQVGPREFEVTGFGSFSKDPNYDVVFLSVAGEDLINLNAALAEEFPDHYNSHGEYHPHLTLAFVKKGLAKDILSRMSEEEIFPIRLPIEKLEFSRADGKTEFIDMDHIRSRARIEVQDED